MKIKSNQESQAQSVKTPFTPKQKKKILGITQIQMFNKNDYIISPMFKFTYLVIGN